MLDADKVIIVVSINDLNLVKDFDSFVLRTHDACAMCLHVAVEVTRLGEPGLADLALVGFFSRVGTVVLGKGRAIGKTFATNVTFVGTISGVSPHVCCDGGALRESPVTYWTFEGFFAAVSA